MAAKLKQFSHSLDAWVAFFLHNINLYYLQAYQEALLTIPYITFRFYIIIILYFMAVFLKFD